MDDEIPEALLRAAESLPGLYADPAHYDVLAQMTAPEDIGFYTALADDAGGPVLELGAGTGRVMLSLAERGHDAYGLELSPAMLSFAREKAAAKELGVTLALGDLRSFDFGRTFPLILLPYNTLNHLLDDDSLARAFTSVLRHMTPDSRFVIDTFQPSLAFLADPPVAAPILRYLDPYDQREVRITEDNRYAPAKQLNTVTWRYCVEGIEDARVEELTMRIFFPRELDALLKAHGFEVISKHGDYDGQPFGDASPKQLCVCRTAQ